MAGGDQAELEYYRSIEDFFASLRGVPHILSTADFELMRTWWRDGVPLSAVRAGIAEVFARRRDRGDNGEIVSLRYCRHGVREQAERIAEMRVGDGEEMAEGTEDEAAAAVDSIGGALRRIATGRRDSNPRLAEVISSIADSIEDLAELPPAAAGEHLFALETSLLAGCLEALETSERTRIEDRARELAEPSSATSDARERAFRAHRDRLVRELLELPRLEL